jgi:hypothetical protein
MRTHAAGLFDARGEWTVNAFPILEHRPQQRGVIRNAGPFIIRSCEPMEAHWLSETTYKLDDQQKAGEYSGQKVSVNGTFDSASKIIHVTSVEAR